MDHNTINNTYANLKIDIPEDSPCEIIQLSSVEIDYKLYNKLNFINKSNTQSNAQSNTQSNAQSNTQSNTQSNAQSNTKTKSTYHHFKYDKPNKDSDAHL